ncbi:hypothetical protein HYH03_002774 [Edaphochlamys debaryana]|uniref:Pherophorin domain-containing protein n=1 Tax=Edaphochlamys debaryana TaxID=47281 RepID=A0A835YDC7_9CHLO|nr:hypothetical protein HYH03_002774 [Edaphochlamys debaryana]|eukprot:KAG2499193.1 hypothetical protein HYH03_002774 [Edaphochlamys debaryana]
MAPAYPMAPSYPMAPAYPSSPNMPTPPASPAAAAPSAPATAAPAEEASPFPGYPCTKPRHTDVPWQPVYSYNATGDQHCWTLRPQTCDPSTSCCNMQIYKYIMLAQPRSIGCNILQGSATLTTDAGVRQLFPSWTWNADLDNTNTRFALLRFVDLNIAANSSSGAKLCFTLNEVCPTLEDFCLNGRCLYSLADDGSDKTIDPHCCPVYAMNRANNGTIGISSTMDTFVPATDDSRRLLQSHSERVARVSEHEILERFEASVRHASGSGSTKRVGGRRSLSAMHGAGLRGDATLESATTRRWRRR